MSMLFDHSSQDFQPWPPPIEMSYWKLSTRAMMMECLYAECIHLLDRCWSPISAREQCHFNHVGHDHEKCTSLVTGICFHTFDSMEALLNWVAVCIITNGYNFQDGRVDITKCNITRYFSYRIFVSLAGSDHLAASSTCPADCQLSLGTNVTWCADPKYYTTVLSSNAFINTKLLQHSHDIHLQLCLLHTIHFEDALSFFDVRLVHLVSLAVVLPEHHCMEILQIGQLPGGAWKLTSTNACWSVLSFHVQGLKGAYVSSELQWGKIVLVLAYGLIHLGKLCLDCKFAHSEIVSMFSAGISMQLDIASSVKSTVQYSHTYQLSVLAPNMFSFAWGPADCISIQGTRKCALKVTSSELLVFMVALGSGQGARTAASVFGPEIWFQLDYKDCRTTRCALLVANSTTLIFMVAFSGGQELFQGGRHRPSLHQHMMLRVPWDPANWLRAQVFCESGSELLLQFKQVPIGYKYYLDDVYASYQLSAFFDWVPVGHDFYPGFHHAFGGTKKRPVSWNPGRRHMTCFDQDMVLRLPWDPGGAAWGQAAFQGGRGVRVPSYTSRWAGTWAVAMGLTLHQQSVGREQNYIYTRRCNWDGILLDQNGERL